MRRTIPAALLAAALVAACGSDPQGDPDGLGSTSPLPQPSTETAEPSPEPSAAAPDDPSGPPRVLRTIATGLEAPWGLTFLPDGTALVSERDTTRVVSVTARGRVREVGRIAAASPVGEAGLLGLAVSPSYDEDGLVYAYVSTEDDNRVVRMTYDGTSLGEPEPILTGIPNGQIHDGGRLAFDADGDLFVSTGEIGQPDLAQDRDSLAGKILKITPDGDPAADNPRSGSPVWSMGHRNVQGLAFDDLGRLWATEFGQNTWDELNRIDRGRNYGWPVFEGEGDDDRYRNPYVSWRTSEASPSGLAYAGGYLWTAALRGERLWRVEVTDDGVGVPQDFFVGDYGRIRTIAEAPDGNLWVMTSNRDGRGDPRPDDDQILLVRP